ncbi:MAG: hypothetical protein H6551_03960 [Chitinophagales bacterium]|nr:hypothetical protein [Chitinophagaceae bacterium]MCB9064279.1 hypothetical protein [Chitinophagales bacterium]
MSPVNYIPIATTVFSAIFFVILYRHWATHKKSVYVFWWMMGVLCYGAGTVTESIHTLFGYSDANFKAWYILGAFLGGVPLAQGTVHLLMKRRTANILSTILIIVLLISFTLVIISPLKPGPHDRLYGGILELSFIRAITPFINTYALIFLVGGAIFSAVKYAQGQNYKSRFWGNVFIAIGGLLPGIGGSAAKANHVEVLYVTEFLGLCFIYAGYYVIKNSKEISLHSNQAEEEA